MKPYLIPIILLPLLIAFSCSSNSTDDTVPEDEAMEEEIIEDAQEIDSLVIGSWKHENFPTAITIDSIGLVTYYVQNQVSGKFERDGAFVDKIRAVNGNFAFLETSACAPSDDSTYAIVDGKLRIPIKKSYQSTDVYFNRTDLASYVGEKRPNTSFITADIIIQNSNNPEIEHQFNSSDENELMTLSSAPNPGSFITGYDAPDFSCNHPMRFHHKLFMITDGPIESTGTFNLIGASVQFAGQTSGNTFNLAYDNGSATFEEGELTITSYDLISNTKYIEGTFEYFMTSEFNGDIDTIFVKNGVLKISEMLE